MFTTKRLFPASLGTYRYLPETNGLPGVLPKPVTVFTTVGFVELAKSTIDSVLPVSPETYAYLPETVNDHGSVPTVVAVLPTSIGLVGFETFITAKSSVVTLVTYA